MKVNITHSPNGQLNGYNNVLLTPQPPLLTSQAVEDAEATEIRALQVLEFYGRAQTAQILDNWLSKLRHGGKLVLSVIELSEVLKSYINGSLTIEDANILLYGPQSSFYDFKKVSVSSAWLCNYLKGKGLRIVSKTVQNYEFFVTAERP